MQGIAIECKRFETTSFGKRVEGFEIKLLFDPKSPEILSCHGWDSAGAKLEDVKLGNIVAIYNAPVQSHATLNITSGVERWILWPNASTTPRSTFWDISAHFIIQVHRILLILILQQFNFLGPMGTAVKQEPAHDEIVLLEDDDDGGNDGSQQHQFPATKKVARSCNRIFWHIHINAFYQEGLDILAHEDEDEDAHPGGDNIIRHLCEGEEEESGGSSDEKETEVVKRQQSVSN